VRKSFTPLTPAVLEATVDMKAGFGSVSLTFSNPTKADLAFVVLVDSLGNGSWAPFQTYYAKTATGKFVRSKLEVEEYKFAVYIRDRWNNTSDTLFKKLTPLKDAMIPKDRFMNAKLPGDSWDPLQGYTEYQLHHLWDGVELRPGTWAYSFASAASSPMPQHFTIDLGRRVQLSRFQLFPRYYADGDLYSQYAPRVFELWGTTNPPDDGSFTNWHLLGRWELYKPSGWATGTGFSAVGKVTEEDKNYVMNNQMYELEENDQYPDPYQEITYLRFRTISTVGTHGLNMVMGTVIISEINFYGIFE
jgi:hypothetical protein